MTSKCVNLLYDVNAALLCILNMIFKFLTEIDGRSRVNEYMKSNSSVRKTLHLMNYYIRFSIKIY